MRSVKLTLVEARVDPWIARVDLYGGNKNWISEVQSFSWLNDGTSRPIQKNPVRQFLGCRARVDSSLRLVDPHRKNQWDIFWHAEFESTQWRMGQPDQEKLVSHFSRAAMSSRPTIFEQKLESTREKSESTRDWQVCINDSFFEHLKCQRWV